MDRGPARSVLREIEALYAVGTLAGLTDAQLLERFLARGGDDAGEAFAALMHRHGPTVLGVCRRMLPASHDAEDAFQATFLVLTRRAASIGRRERLASWLYGVAVRTAREARRRSARDRAIERRLMVVTQAESDPPEDRDDLLPLLDEELSRLPERYRSALVACELEGKSRHEAALHLGVPEGTLSTHLARGRKLLRERLSRRGVTLAVGPIAGLTRPSFEAAIPDRLLGPTIRAAMNRASGYGTAGTISQTATTLAERVLKMMFLARLTLVIVALLTASGAVVGVVVGWSPPAAAPAVVDEPAPGPDDLAGRITDSNGTAVADVQVWALAGRWIEPVMIATATTDRQGRYVLPGARAHKAIKASRDERLGLFARARDGRIGWLTNYWRDHPGDRGGDIELMPVGEVRGRVSDQDGRPMAGATVTIEQFWKPNGMGFSQPIELVPETVAPYQTATAADGSFALQGVPLGSSVQAKITVPGRGPTRISWNTAQPGLVTLDRRLGLIKGRLKPMDGRGYMGSMRVFVRYDRPRGKPAPGAVSLVYNDGVNAGKDGSFQFDGLPPGRYQVDASSQNGAPFIPKAVGGVEVAPNGVAMVEVPLERLIALTGRVIDAETGKGVPDIAVACYHVQDMYLKDMRSATTDAEGRYSVPAQPGTVHLEAQGLPKTYLGPTPAEYPNFDVKADRAVPDLKLTHATGLEGVVVDEAGHPVKGAEIYFLFTPERRWTRREEPMRTGPDGTFHLDQLNPDDKAALWARFGDATTSGATIVRPRQGKVTLTLDPKYTVRLHGVATDSAGRRIAGAKVTLWATRWCPPEKEGGRPMMASGRVLETYTTKENGLFVFRGLWPDAWYNVVVEAKGHDKGETLRIDAKAGETRDLGKIVLMDTNGRVAGRVVDSGGRPVAARRSSTAATLPRRSRRPPTQKAGSGSTACSRGPGSSSSASRATGSRGSRTTATPTI